MFCQNCEAVENLQKHHISYNPPKTISLCKICHQKQHKGRGTGAATFQSSATFQKKIIPSDFPENWKNLSYKELMDKYGISYATVYDWSIEKQLGQKLRVEHKNFQIKIPEVLEWTCTVPNCNKKIFSLYPKQLEALKKQHMIKHELKEKPNDGRC